MANAPKRGIPQGECSGGKEGEQGSNVEWVAEPLVNSGRLQQGLDDDDGEEADNG